MTAMLPDGRVVLGLPGNPVAAVATFADGVAGDRRRADRAHARRTVTGAVSNASQVGASVARIVPVTRQWIGTWRADTIVRTAHLAGLIGREALALVPPAPVDGQSVELLPSRRDAGQSG